MPTELPLDALEMALFTPTRGGQDVAGVVHHSDAGSQYTAIRYTERLLDAGALPSIGSVGDSYDNALAESTISLYKAERVRHDGPWRTVDALELGTLSWIDWYNTCRLHSSIGDIPPIEYEQHHHDRHINRRSSRCRHPQVSTEPGAIQSDYDRHRYLHNQSDSPGRHEPGCRSLGSRRGPRVRVRLCRESAAVDCACAVRGHLVLWLGHTWEVGVS